MIHECGHFLAAKLCGVKVNEFALGMGPALFKKKKGETLYALRLFPIGGYCAMEGDHVANTPKQLVVYEALGWEAPKFGHMTLIINSETGKKLSKRDESVLQFIEQYRDLGYLPDAMFNFITLLG